MKGISQFIHKICYYALGISLIVVTFVLTINVILRYCFASGWAWAEELTQYIIVWTTFVGAACCVSEGSDITIDSILSLLNKKGQKIVSCITYVISIIFLLIMIYSSVSMVQRAYVNGQTATSMNLKMWIIYIAIPVGAALTVLRIIEKLVYTIKGEGKEGDK